MWFCTLWPVRQQTTQGKACVVRFLPLTVTPGPSLPVTACPLTVVLAPEIRKCGDGPAVNTCRRTCPLVRPLPPERAREVTTATICRRRRPGAAKRNSRVAVSYTPESWPSSRSPFCSLLTALTRWCGSRSSTSERAGTGPGSLASYRITLTEMLRALLGLAPLTGGAEGAHEPTSKEP